MCLQRVTRQGTAIRQPVGYGVGWKVFRVSKTGRVYGEYYHTTRPYLVGQWVRSRGGMVRAVSGITYPVGFHIFTTQRAVERNYVEGLNVIHRVRYRQVVARGVQWDERIVVAREIWIEAGGV